MAGKLVGITCSTLPASGRSGPRQMLNRAYVWAVEQAGGVPLILPVTNHPEDAEKYLPIIDGLLLSGGVDVAPERYGQAPHPALGEVDPERDALEIALARAAVAHDMPIFGICRGMQVLNVALGGTLYQDLPSQKPDALPHDQNVFEFARSQSSHSIQIAPDTRLHALMGTDTIAVNSFHHQALERIAPGLVVTARADDGVIEAIEGPDKHYLLAVQSHPEEMAARDENARRLFQAFVRAL